jgi:DNA repair protein SbcC/Rad50
MVLPYGAELRCGQEGGGVARAACGEKDGLVAEWRPYISVREVGTMPTQIDITEMQCLRPPLRHAVSTAGRDAARVWNQLDELIGSADGAKFRRFAQSMTFSHLIRLANRHLNDLYPRYELQRAPSGELVLQVLDRDMADEVRGVHNLSGGERFLVSLALALGLATMSSSHGIRVETLLIDEGFGSLDRNSTAMAVSVLEQLQATGRRVPVISHLEELKERIAVKVQVVPVGGGRSILEVVMA